MSCQTVRSLSTSSIGPARTDPVAATRPRLFRSRSAIMTFSARSFSEERSRSRTASSSSGKRPRRAVPFMGRVITVSPRRSRKSSGEAEITAREPART